ncbi:hypothetical protein [Aeromicrobium sp. CF3.5]|uniref:hypothetical protein n=1 Tax=Aeromicrobium sp. CF3.5 TaxID=3373078 RepID=UPI003EE7DD58
MDARQSAIETYRYLRVGIVGLAVLLAVSVVAQAVADGHLLGSISAYYFTPVRDVFVGVLVALGLSLIAVRGRGIEDVLLNLAGLLAPIVAFVPTSSTGDPLPDSDNAVRSLIIVGAIGVGFAALTARRLGGEQRRQAELGVISAASVIAGFAGWLAAAPDSFHTAAHYVAAVGMFAAFVVVARLNATSASDHEETPLVAMLPAARRAAAYRLISWSMLITVLAAAALGLLDLAGVVPIPLWLLWAESVLLVLFAAFWVLQTVEYWTDGVPLD